MGDPVLSMVTGTRNRPESFKRLLDSITTHATLPWELIVSDASEQPYVEVLPDNVYLIHEKPRLGYVKGYNAMFRRAMGQWVLWLNDDCEVQPHFDTEAVNFMESHPSIGLGCLPFSDPQWHGFQICTYLDIPYANFGIIRRANGNSIGWFDEELTMYGSDNAITFEVLLYGLGVAEIPKAKIVHHRVQDETRIENQVGRLNDTSRLQAKYLPRRRDLVYRYRRLRIA